MTRSRPTQASLLTCVVLLVLGSVSRAQSRLEIRPVASVTVTTQQFLAGDDEHAPVTIAAELRLPAADARYGGSNAGPANGLSPAVILIHGSGGILPYHKRWVQELHSVGIATLLVDSFSARGIVNTANDQTQLASLAMMIDAYRGLGALAEDPRIDANRIAVMGFSKGAVASVYSSSVRFTKMYAPRGLRFAAHVGIYTPCYHYREDDVVTGSPIRLFHGAADDYVPSAPCKTYIARLTRNGADARLTEYPNAHHLYDNFLQGPPITDPQAQSLRRCDIIERDRGILVNASTNHVFTFNDACVERGATRGYDAAAAAATITAVKEFLLSTFASKQ